MLDREWLATFAPVGLIPGPEQWQPGGACLFALAHDQVWLVTARHVLADRALPFGVLVPINDQPTLLNLTEIMERSGVDWIVSQQYDLAVAPMPTPPGIGIKALAQEHCMPIDQVLPSMPTLSAGCPYGIPGVGSGRPTPLVLDGVIAGTEPQGKRLFISTPTFPGNSGGPCFVIRHPFNAGGALIAGQQTVFLAAIVSQVVTIQPQNDAKAAPLRLGLGISTDAVFELLNGPEALAMMETIKSNRPNP